MFRILIPLLLSAVTLGSAQLEKQRRPKLFFISTSATTSTLKTLSVCFTTNAALTSCGERRRRSLILDNFHTDQETGVMMAPSKTQRLEEDVEDDDERLESDDLQIFSSKETERDGRFLLYWKTTTLTSTSTTYTATHSLKKLECTPSGFQMAACG